MVVWWWWCGGGGGGGVVVWSFLAIIEPPQLTPRLLLVNSVQKKLSYGVGVVVVWSFLAIIEPPQLTLFNSVLDWVVAISISIFPF